MAKKPGRPVPPGGKGHRNMESFFENLLGPMESWPDPDAEDAMLDFDPVADLLELFAESGAIVVSPAILQPADAFLDTVGEDIRRRLFITEGPDGEQLCLRPEFTIPVCLDYLDSETAGQPEALAYLGPVFRQRQGEPAEFPQAGIERFGDADPLKADADLLKLAVDAVESFGLVDAEIRIGDEGLFSALLDVLDLPTAVRRRLRAAFGDEARMEKTLQALAARDSGDLSAHAGFLGAIAKADPDDARSVVEDLLAIAGIKAVGTRTAHEIAERFLEKAAANASGGLTEEKARHIRRFLEIEGTPDDAAARLRRFVKETKLDINRAIGQFETRNAHLRETGLDVDGLAFSTKFGRNPDYYTGFVFELRDPDREDGKPVVGGGRYDGLLQRLGSPVAIPAAGFSIWLDRLMVELDLAGLQA